MAEKPPYWAYVRVREILGWPAGSDYNRNSEYAPIEDAFGHYVAQHEEAPVAPLLIEAREIAADDYARQDMPGLSRNIRDGLFDDNAEVRTVLTALRRGIEIGSAK